MKIACQRMCNFTLHHRHQQYHDVTLNSTHRLSRYFHSSRASLIVSVAHYNVSSITDTLWLLGKFYSFFLLLPIPLSHQHVHSLLLVNKHDQLKPEHNVKDVLKSWLITFFGNLTYFTGGFMLSNISCNDQE